MNTIPTTSKQFRIPYTVAGGQKGDRVRKSPVLLSLLLLNRGGRPFRQEILKELKTLGFDEIISIEGPQINYDVESLALKFPNIRFLLLHQQVSRGEQINMGIEEAKGRFVFVLWNDIRIAPSSLSRRLLEKIQEEEVLCVVPLIKNQRQETLPTVQAPAFDRKRLRVLPLQPNSDGMVNLFPFDYLGIYHRGRFLLTGGFDYSIKNPWWQKLDFGFRSFMWGEKILCSTALRVSYLGDVPSEDTTPDSGYKRFFLKNLSIRFTGDSGVLPGSRFLPFAFRSGGGIFSAYKEFKAAQKWVEINTFRFQQDARGITELWEVPEV